MNFLEIIVALGFTIIGFIGMWFGAGIVVKTTELISKNLHLSSFVVSFLLLGTLTTIPEISILFTSLQQGDVKISLGNLMGGILVIMTFIIPGFSIVKDGINLKNTFEKDILGFVVLFALLPFLLSYDKVFNGLDGLIILFSYIFLIYKVIQLQSKKTTQELNSFLSSNVKIIDLIKQLLILPLGLFIIFVCGDILSDQMIYFGSLFNVNTFIISFLILGIGTNLPEISIMIRALKNKYLDIALGDYFGSIVANLLLISLAIILGGPINIQDNVALTVSYVIISFTLFYLFFRLNNKLSAYEGYIILSLFVIFYILKFSFFLNIE